MLGLFALVLAFLTANLFRILVDVEKDAIVDTGYAHYLGNVSLPNTVSYLGIPYAEPPLGELRFRKPLPLNTTRLKQEHQGVIDSRSYPNFCVQGGRGGLDSSCSFAQPFKPLGSG